MPKSRKRSGSRELENRVIIVCEGKKNKSEYSYLNMFIKNCRFAGNKVEVALFDTQKNTGKELVREVLKLKQFSNDIAWIVYDKDGYTKHPETFLLARQKDVNIAFSSISFEYWVLIHFKQTSRPFTKSEEIIKFMKDNKLFDYSKKNENLFLEIKDKLDIAITNARWIQKKQIECNPVGSQIYTFNPYTNLNELIESIKSLESE